MGIGEMRNKDGSESGLLCDCTQLAHHLHEGFYTVDPQRKIVSWNSGAERITGFSAEEVKGSFCWNDILRHMDGEGNMLCREGCPLAHTLKDGRVRDAGVFLFHKLGHRVPVLVRVFPIKDADGCVVGAGEVFVENTPLHRMEKRIRELEEDSLLDKLTGLPNRRYTESFLRERMNLFGRYGLPFGVLFADLDHFKMVNDRFGHQTGDLLLQAISRTFQNNTRRSDLVGRWGGEEFLAVLTGVDRDLLAMTARKFLHLIAATEVRCDGEAVATTISLGATMVRAGDSLSRLVERADQLMYLSKAEGRNRYSMGKNKG